MEKTPASEQEHRLRDTLDTLEYPRMMNKADGTQVRVENSTEAKQALADGLTLVPTAPSPNDGGTPTVPVTPNVPPAIAAAIQAAVAAAVPSEPAATVEDDEDNGKKRRR